ncbi:MAG: hypothetical protein AB7I33_03995 [Gemmatimonadales bacterium]
MVSLTALWLPILVSAVLVFIVSSIVHMALGYHKSDYKPLQDEEAVRAALGRQNLPPGIYHVPHCADMKAMGSPEMTKKYEEGPVALIALLRNGRVNMGPYLVQWFLYSLLISILCAYVAGRTLDPGTHYLEVFRVVGTVAWMAYGVSAISGGIWKAQPWSNVAKEVFDGLIYACVTAGAFGWRWPV